MFGDQGPLMYLVRETGTTYWTRGFAALRSRRITAARRHFTGALDVDYRVITSADDLP